MVEMDPTPSIPTSGGAALYLRLWHVAIVDPCGMERRLDIDGLRLVASAAVVVHHVDKHWLPGGFTGVDVFYVISGFCVTLAVSSRERQRKAGRCLNDVFGFYARRIRRLVPLVLAVILATTLAIAAVLPPLDEAALEARRRQGIMAEGRGDEEAAKMIYEAGLASIFGWTNNYFALRTIYYGDGGYWGTGRASTAFNPFTHFWSLGVEEQFVRANSST